MSKVKVVYWSGTGNTEAMANKTPDNTTVDECKAMERSLA